MGRGRYLVGIGVQQRWAQEDPIEWQEHWQVGTALGGSLELRCGEEGWQRELPGARGYLLHPHLAVGTDVCVSSCQLGQQGSVWHGGFRSLR